MNNLGLSIRPRLFFVTTSEIKQGVVSRFKELISVQI